MKQTRIIATDPKYSHGGHVATEIHSWLRVQKRFRLDENTEDPMIRSCFRHLFMRKLYNSLIINVDWLRCGCPESQYIKENHGQALAPNGALSLSLRNSLASKLAGYSVGWDSPLRGLKSFHVENRYRVKLRRAHKIIITYLACPWFSLLLLQVLLPS